MHSCDAALIDHPSDFSERSVTMLRKKATIGTTASGPNASNSHLSIFLWTAARGSTRTITSANMHMTITPHKLVFIVHSRIEGVTRMQHWQDCNTSRQSHIKFQLHASACLGWTWSGGRNDAYSRTPRSLQALWSARVYGSTKTTKTQPTLLVYFMPAVSGPYDCSTIITSFRR